MEEGCYIIGQYFNGEYTRPEGKKYCVDAAYDDMFAKPTKWDKGWDDSGTGGHRDGSFWWPTCPLGYAAVGGVATY